MNRRTFLSLAAGAPLVYGLRELLAQDPPAPSSDVPDWYGAALKRMKETRRYGVMIIVPDDPKVRERWGKALIDRSNDGIGPDGLVRLGVVLICTPKSLASACLGKAAPEKENRLLLDPDGRKLSWDEMGVEVLEKQRDFDQSLHRLVWAEDSNRMKDRADELEKSVPDPVRKAVADLSGNEGRGSEEAIAVIVKEGDAFMPWVILKLQEALKAASDERGVIRRMVHLWKALTQYSIAQRDKIDDANLPFGVKVESIPHDSCPSCGLHARPMRVRRFLEFLAK